MLGTKRSNSPSQGASSSSSHPTSKVCHLLRIPPEVLKVVAEGAGGHALACLWRCCNPILNLKLSSPSGVNTFDLWLPNTTRMDRFPTLLTQLQGLTRVRIELRKDVGAMPVLGADLLALLPKTIQEISFRFKEAEECWMRASGRQNMEPWQESEEPLCFDFAEHFPDLHTLKLVAPSPHQNNIITSGQYRYGAPMYGRISDRAVGLLPRGSLAVLELPSNDTLTPPGIASLPSTLCELNLQWTNMFKIDTHVEIAFQNFTSLRVLQLGRSSEFKAAWVKHLPKTLEYLDLNRCTTFSGPELKDLPRTLTHLDIEFSTNLDAKCLALLPSKLAFLNIGMCKNITGYELALLPSTLTWLDIWCATALGNLKLSNLPTNLATLKIGNFDAPLKKEDLEMLPRSLTHLNLESYSSIQDGDIEALPKRLITLILRNATKLTPACFQTLPKTLTKLDVAQNQQIRSWDSALLPEGLRRAAPK